jgi:hypothetical protein
MAFVQIRTFTGRIGKADEIVGILKEIDGVLVGSAGTQPSRILTDHYSGRTDRIVWEITVANLADVDAMIATATETPEQQATFGAWFQRLSDAIHYAEVENWQIA